MQPGSPRRQLLITIGLVILLIVFLFLLVALNWLGAEAATAYAVVLHAIMMVVLIVLGAWGLSRMDLNLGELMAEIRQYVQRGEKGPEAEAVEEITQEAQAVTDPD